jgi:hypothetical protein
MLYMLYKIKRERRMLAVTSTHRWWESWRRFA